MVNNEDDTYGKFQDETGVDSNADRDFFNPVADMDANYRVVSHDYLGARVLVFGVPLTEQGFDVYERDWGEPQYAAAGDKFSHRLQATIHLLLIVNERTPDGVYGETAQSTVSACVCGPATQRHVNVPANATELRGSGNPCIVPDNGSGTVTLPPAGCAYQSPSDIHLIINGLPPGTTVRIGVEHHGMVCPSISSGICNFAGLGSCCDLNLHTCNNGVFQGICQGPSQSWSSLSCSQRPPICGVGEPPICRQSGGSLGGEQECFTSGAILTLNGTGTLAGYSRSASLQLDGETEVAPRTPGQPVQSFDTQMFRLQGQLAPGDPDFDLLRITAGTDFGLPSPGHTTLTQLSGGNWAVDSFFDITYRIEFIGHPGGPFNGMSGSTTGTIRMATGNGPSCIGGCPPGFACRETRTVNPDGTIDICCNCVLQFQCACPGDVSLNCIINVGDIQRFINCLLLIPQPSPLGQPCDCADINRDGVVNQTDVNLFVGLLLSVPKSVCPPGCVPMP